ncbi:MAG: FAD-dependent oxidoreductase [Alphaproteobacteria bacterium]|nr:FAD-dependent oxidoreductase [Alphaproteobacteria bacterium]
MSRLTHDVAIIGAGAAGLVTAGGLSQFGLRVVLFEAGEMGGECLNTGCVPSKALLAAGHAVAAARHGAALGVRPGTPEVDWAGVNAHIARTIAAIAPHDSQERFEGFGCDVVRAVARLTGPDTIEADGRSYRARRIVLATGSEPAVPPIPGLADVPFLTNETLFGIPDQPTHLIVLGGGAIGCEMAQAHARLGCAVTLIEADRLLPRDDPEHAAVVAAALAADGVTIHAGRKAVKVEGGPTVTLDDGTVIVGSHLLVAVGRKARTHGYGLEAAGVEAGPNGIRVDARLRTSNTRIFAVGDCRDGPRLTHAAGYDAGIVIRNIAFRLPAKANYAALPAATYTDPEIAQVGLTEAGARARHGAALTVLRSDFAHNDRARAEGRTEGLIKVMAVKGRPVGVSIVGPHAGDLIGFWQFAVANRVKLSAIAGMIAPYPSWGESAKAVAGTAFTETLFSPRVRAVVRLLARLG